MLRVFIVLLFYWNLFYASDIGIRNFNPIIPGKIYRSGMFDKKDLLILKNELNLKTILFLHDTNDQDYLTKEENKKIRESNEILKEGIRMIRLPFDGNTPDLKVFLQALEIVFDSANYPLLFHCQGGKHRTGMLSMAIRKGLGGKWNIPVKFYINHDLEIKLYPKDADFIAENLGEYEYFTYFTYGKWFEKPFLQGPRQENLDFVRQLDLTNFKDDFKRLSNYIK